MRMPSLAARTLPVSAGVLLVALAASVLPDYGITTDEGPQATYGEMALDFYGSLGRDDACNTFRNLRHYGPLAEMIPAAVYRATGADPWRVRHAFAVLLGLSTVLAAALFARRLAGTAAGWIAAAALLATPRFVGHSFNNGKDVAAAAGVAWSLVALAAVFSGRERPSRWRLLGTGAILGVAWNFRPGSIPFLAGLLGLAVVAALLPAGRGTPALRGAADPERAGAALSAGRTCLHAVVVVLVAWVVLVLGWPWALEDPLGNPIRSIGVALRFPVPYDLVYRGEVIRSDDLPWHYLPLFLAISTPLPHLVLAAGGTLAAARAALDPARRVHAALLVAWTWVPILSFVVMRPNVLDGARHFLFVVPAMACGVAVAVVSAVRAFVPPRLRPAAFAAAALLVASPVVDMVRLHPYQTTYFNESVGGVAGAAGRFETDYYLNSYREAVAWIRNRSPSEHPAPGMPVRVLLVGSDFLKRMAAAYSGDGLEVLALADLEERGLPPASVQYVVSTTRANVHHAFQALKPVHCVGREGVCFSIVFTKSPRAAGEGEDRRDVGGTGRVPGHVEATSKSASISM